MRLALLLLAALGLSSCGIQDDNFACERACDKQFECQYVLGDAGWQSCFESCSSYGASLDYALCFESYECGDDFAANVEAYCSQNPLTDALRQVASGGR